MATSEEILIEIRAQFAEAQAELDKLKKSVNDASGAQKDNASATKTNTAAHKENNAELDSAKRGLSQVTQSLTGLTPELLTAGGAIVGLAEGIKASVDAAVQLGTQTRSLSLLIGSSAEESSKLIAVSDDLGVSYESLTRGMEAAIRKGYSPTIQGLAEMGEKYRSIQDPIARSKYLLDTFGRSGAELAPILEKSTQELNAMAEADAQAGLVMDSEGVRRTREYKLALNDLNDQFTGFKIRVGDALIPALTDTVKWLSQATVDVGKYANAINNAGLSSHEWLMQTLGLKTAQQSEMEAVIASSVSTENFRKAEEAASAATNDSTQAMLSSKQAAKDLAFDLSNLTQKSLFDLAAKTTDDSEKQLELGRAMGVVSEKSIYAQQKIAEWTAEVEAGHMTWSVFLSQVTALGDALNNIPTNKHITLTLDTIENHTVNRKVSGDVTDTQDSYTSTADIMARTAAQQAAQEITRNLSRGNVAPRAIGGPAGGLTLVGEDGPELVNLPLGSQVINNYNTHYNLTAHYPGYQDPNAARNDLIAMTLLKNAGASKWAAS